MIGYNFSLPSSSEYRNLIEKDLLCKYNLRKFISFSTTFQDYINTIFEEEVDYLKKRREEDFSLKRNILWKKEDLPKNTQEEENNEQVRLIKRKEATQIKEIMESTQNEEHLEKILNYISFITIEAHNLDLLIKEDIPFLISKILKNTSIRNMRLIQCAIVAIGSFCEKNKLQFYSIKPVKYFN
jgi:hypothetical protein